jgi:hypothetical protein
MDDKYIDGNPKWCRRICWRHFLINIIYRRVHMIVHLQLRIMTHKPNPPTPHIQECPSTQGRDFMARKWIYVPWFLSCVCDNAIFIVPARTRLNILRLPCRTVWMRHDIMIPAVMILIWASIVSRWNIANNHLGLLLDGDFWQCGRQNAHIRELHYFISLSVTIRINVTGSHILRAP